MLDGQFTISSAYDCQFKGAISLFPTSDVWKAYTEPKSKFFFLPGWLSITKLLRLITWLQKVGPATPCALCGIANQNHFIIISLRAATTSRLSGMPLLPTSTSRIMSFWALIKVCCSGSQSSIRQVAEKKGRLNSAFSFPFDSNCGKKKIGECFRLKRNPSYRLLLSFRMRLLFYLLCDAGSSQAMLSSLDHLKSWSQAELLLSQGAVFVGLWAFLFPVFRMLSVSLKKALLVRCFLF
jgi:hypothetical protein